MSEDNYLDDDEFEHNDIAELESRIEDLESRISNLDDLESTIDDLESKINGLESKIEIFKNSVQAISEKVEFIGRYLRGYSRGLWAIGMAISVVISWEKNHSILWAFLHGVLSWVYIIWAYRWTIWDWLLTLVTVIGAWAQKTFGG